MLAAICKCQPIDSFNPEDAIDILARTRHLFQKQQQAKGPPPEPGTHQFWMERCGCAIHKCRDNLPNMAAWSVLLNARFRNFDGYS